MFDIDLKNIKKGYKFYFAFLFAGLLFLTIFLVLMFNSYSSYKSLDSKTTARINVGESVKDGNTMYSPVYYYEVDGKNYQCKTSYSSSIRPKKENGIVYYSAKEPSKCISDYTINMSKWMLLLSLLPLIFILVAGIGIKKVNTKIKKVKLLNQNGKLVKNLPYRLEQSGHSVNSQPILRIVVDYVLPTGELITLKGAPRYDRKHSDADGFVDILIDEQDPTSYFIDYEINRLEGNRKEDYYKVPEQHNNL